MRIRLQFDSQVNLRFILRNLGMTQLKKIKITKINNQRNQMKWKPKSQMTFAEEYLKNGIAPDFNKLKNYAV